MYYCCVSDSDGVGGRVLLTTVFCSVVFFVGDGSAFFAAHRGWSLYVWCASWFLWEAVAGPCLERFVWGFVCFLFITFGGDYSFVFLRIVLLSVCGSVGTVSLSVASGILARLHNGGTFVVVECCGITCLIPDRVVRGFVSVFFAVKRGDFSVYAGRLLVGVVCRSYFTHNVNVVY